MRPISPPRGNEQTPQSLFGIMSKKGRGQMNSMIRPWNDRLFILNATNMTLSYYTIPARSENWLRVSPPAETKRGELNLHNCKVSIIPEAESGKLYTFNIKTESDGDLLISAGTKPMRDEWIRAIQSASKHRAISPHQSLPRAIHPLEKRTMKVLRHLQVENADADTHFIDAEKEAQDILAQTLMGIANANAGVASALPAGVEVHIVQSNEKHGAALKIQERNTSPARIASEKRRQEERQQLMELAREQEEQSEEQRKGKMLDIKKQQFRHLAQQEASKHEEVMHWRQTDESRPSKYEEAHYDANIGEKSAFGDVILRMKQRKAQS